MNPPAAPQLRTPLVFLVLAIAVLAIAASAVAQAPADHPPSVASAYGNLPLSFESNQGQTDPSVQFLVHGQGYTLFLRPGEAVFGLEPVKASAKTQISPASEAQPKAQFIRIQLAGANLKAPAIAEDPQISRTNYFLGNNPAQWRTDIPNYSRVHYRSVYEGIDLVYYGNQRRLEHDFIVAPHADPTQIVLSVSGQQTPQIDSATGDLILVASTSENKASLRLLKPITYQETNGRRTEIPTSYKLLANNKIGFSIAPYDHTQPLIIDPVLTYSTYLGGSGSNGNGDQGNGIAVDSAGNAYVVGTAYSTNFPITAISFQNQNPAPAGASTVFVTKLNPAGTALVYSTYFGGTGGDAGYGIALDSANNAYITGATYSTDFPVTCDAFQTANPSTTSGAPTAFVARINATGNDLGYSTYLGGSGNGATPAHGDVSQAIAVDSTGSAYVTGYTWSPDFPTTTGAVQPDFAGSATVSNAFVAKLNPAGKALTYATYLGGSGSNGAGDYGNAIALDSSADAFIAGSTASTDFPVTTGALQTSSTSVKAFVTELNPAGSKETFSTYLGGTAGDSANAIAVDTSGNVYVAGNTNSSDFPTTSGVLEPSSYWIGPPQGFVSKLKPGGAALAYSTYLEGQGTTIAALAVDSTGTAYIAGSASTTYVNTWGGFVRTGDSLNTPAGPSSAFIVELDPSAAMLNYASLLGGSASDAATALALDSSGNVYLTGIATSTNFPLTYSPFQGTLGAPNGSLIPTTLTVLSQQFLCDIHSPGFTVDVDLMVNSNATGPGPTGTVNFIGSFVVGESAIPVSPASNGTATVSLIGTSADQVAQSATWEADYTGDSIYAPATLTGETNGPGNCDSEPLISRRQATGQTRQDQTMPLTRQLKSAAPAHADLPVNAHGNSIRPNNLSSATGSNAFISKFALTGETFPAVYPPPIVKVAPQIATFTADYQGSGCTATDCPDFVVNYYAQVTGQNGLAVPTGTVTFTGPDSNTSGKVTLVNGVAAFNGEDSTAGGVNPNGATITAAYSGDRYFLPSSATATMTFFSNPATTTSVNLGWTPVDSGCSSQVELCVSTVVGPVAAGGPPLTGCFDLEGDAGGYTVCYPDSIDQFNANISNTGGFACVEWTYYGGSSTYSATATYYQDPIYQGSTASVTIDGQNCDNPSDQFSASRPANHALQLHLPLIPRTAQASGSTMKPLKLVNAARTPETVGPKFTPAPAVSRLNGPSSLSIRSQASQAAPACIVPGQTAAPVFSVAGGTYESVQTVTITSRTPDSTIYYTTNGTTPTNASAKYTAPIVIKSAITLQAIAYAPSIPPSSVTSAAYTLDAAAPVFSPPSGAYLGPLTVTITSATPTAGIAYTPNGNIPSVYATYTGPITISASGKVYALAHETGFATSATTEAIYTIETPATTPVFSLAAGTYTGAQTLTITDTTPGAAIRYTLDGTTPTASSTLYSSPVVVSTSETVKAIVFATGYLNSAVASAAYTINIPGGFGSLPVNIGSNTTATITVTILSAATLGNISVLTQGASNLDFTNAGGGSCAVGTAYAAGAACTVQVTFAPKFAGTRVGAVVLTDSTGSPNVIATAYLQGLGLGPQIAFSPGAPGAVAYDCGTFTSGIAVDGSGNLFVLDDDGGTLWKLTPGNLTGCYIQPTKIGIFAGAKDIAIDGSGSLYIAGNTLYKEKLLPDGSYQQTTVAGGFTNSWGVAVDASGNVYLAVDAASSNQAAVYKETLQANGTYVQSTIGSGWTEPSGLAVDGNGNVYIADFYTGVLVKETLANATYTQTTIDSELFHPAGVAVDGTGNVYISDDIDSPFEDGSPAIFKEIPQSDGSYDLVTIASYPSFSPESLAVDGGGNIYYADSYANSAYELNFENPPSLSFASTTHGTTSKDSPQTVTAYNFGNAPLNFSAVSYPIDFPEGSPDTNDCKASMSLAANQSCTLTIDFTPVTAIGSSTTSLSLSENVELTTNSLNTTGALQAIAVAGTEVDPVTAAPIFSVPGGQYTSPQSVALTDSTPGSTIYYTTNGAQPTTASTQYAGPINVSTPQVIFAFAVAPGHSPSAVVQQDYFIDTQTPVFSVPTGTYASVQTVAITDSSAGAVIYYTTDGTTPITSSTKYTGPISVASTETIKAVAFAPGLDASAFASATYTIHLSTTGELQFVPITPCRIADTRNPAGAFGGPELAAASTRTFDIPQSACNIPASATAYSLNATVVPGSSLGFLTLWPAGQLQPVVSTLNSDGRVKANAAITPAGVNGGISVYASDATQFILDIDGYFVPAGASASGLEFYPLTPCRVADTRNAAGSLGGPSLAAKASRNFPVLSSACNIPATAKAYSLNITAVPHGPLGYLTAWPAGQTQPDVSTLNSSTGAVTANAAIVSAGSSGEVSIFVSDAADVILDINGYFAPPATGGLSLYTVTPCRVLDTRNGSGAFNGLLAVPVHASACAPPAAAQAYILNATVLPSEGLGYLTLWTAGVPQPNVSTLNADDAAITSNMAIVSTTNGSIDAYSTNPTQLILDLSGYFAP